MNKDLVKDLNEGLNGLNLASDREPADKRRPLKLALILFNGVTFLDFAGFYDVMTRVKKLDRSGRMTLDLCGLTGEVADEQGMTVKVHRVEPDLSAYDLIFMPGGFGTRTLKDEAAFVDWLRTAGKVPYKVSVCTGALLLGAAGFLRNLKATTNPSAYSLLAPYCREVLEARIVRDGTVITGGGVAASIDLGLYLAELWDGRAAAAQIRKAMDYPYQAHEIVELS